MNIAFYVSAKAGRLRKILDQQDPAVLESTKLIFSDDRENAYLSEDAVAASIEYQCMHFEDIVRTEIASKSMIMSDSLLASLRRHQIDYCFSFGDHLLVGKLLHEYRNRIINFHPSVLPMFPGLRAIDQAVEAGAHLLGNTAHFIDEGVDTGAVIMQNVVSRRVFGTGGYEAVLDQQLPMFHQIFTWLDEDRIAVADGAVVVKDAGYDTPVFFPELEDGR